MRAKKEARGSQGQMTRQMAAAIQLALPGGTLSSTVSVLGLLGGAIFWTVYVHLLIPKASLYLFLGYAGFGSASGLMMVAFYRLIWHFIRKQYYRVVLKQFHDRSNIFVARARKELTEDEAGKFPEAEKANDLAVVEFLQRNFSAAADGFQQAGDKYDSAEAKANLVVALAETGHWDRLLAVLERLAAEGGKLDDRNLGRVYALAPGMEDSELAWRLATQMRHPMLLNNLGVRALRVSGYEKAEEAFRLALEIDPNYGPAHANLGVLAYRRDDLQGALVESAVADSLLSNNEIIFANLGVFYGLGGDQESARKALVTAQKLQPRNTGIQVNLGNMWVQANRIEDGIKSLSACLSWGGYEAEAYYNLALAHIRQKNLAQALEDLTQARQHNSSDPDVLSNLGWVLYSQGNFDVAYKCFHQAVDVNPSTIYVRNLLRAQLGAGKVKEAFALLKRLGPEAEGLEFERGVTHLLLATSEEVLSDSKQAAMSEFHLDSAVEEFKHVLNSGQGPLNEAQLNTGLAHYFRADYRAASQAFVSIVRRTEDFPQLNYLTGMCYVLEAVTVQEKAGLADEATVKLIRELFTRARPQFQKAIEVPKLAESAYYDLAVLEYKLGDYHKAVEMCRHISTTNASRQVLNTLGIIQARMAQELQRYQLKAQNLTETNRRRIRVEVRNLLTAAITEFRRALEFDPYAALTHANLGLALMIRNEGGDIEAALEHWQAMNLHGDEEASKTYQALMQSMSAENANNLSFQDVELSFQTLRVHEWVALMPPVLLGHKYVVQELSDTGEWRLVAFNEQVKRALIYLGKIEYVEARLRKLAI